MDQVTQQNAALVEEAAAAAESMQDQAARLAQVAAGFQLEHVATTAPVRPARPAATRLAKPVAKSTTARQPGIAARSAPAARKPKAQVAGEQDWEEF